jgi:hypothetical protein
MGVKSGLVASNGSGQDPVLTVINKLVASESNSVG